MQSQKSVKQVKLWNVQGKKFEESSTTKGKSRAVLYFDSASGVYRLSVAAGTHKITNPTFRAMFGGKNDPNENILQIQAGAVCYM